jgi:gluconate 2-dehydrogenase gamma chain
MSLDENSALLFLSLPDAALVDAIAARIVPGDAADPGAHEALVYRYIDRTLSGAHRAYQQFYRCGLAALRACSVQLYGHDFVELSDDDRDSVLAVVAAGEAPGFDVPSAGEFFEVIRGHVIEGMFADPAHGGNAGCVGWRLIGYPGTQYEYTAQDSQPGADLSKKPIMTLADLQRTIQAAAPRGFNG